MQLGISSDAAPDASVADLLDACARRGLAALELTAHAATASDDHIRQLTSGSSAAGLKLRCRRHVASARS